MSKMVASLTQGSKFNIPLEDILFAENILDIMTDEQRDEIAAEVKRGYDTDEQSREPWLEQNKKWLRMAMQFSRRKSTPIPNSANVQYPMLTVAALQFAARAYASLCPAEGPVKGTIIGQDTQQIKVAKMRRAVAFMNIQLMKVIKEWEENSDKLLLSLPIVGTLFRKKWWDEDKGRFVDRVLYPQDVCVNYHATSMTDVQRITEVKWMTTNMMLSMINKGIWQDFDPGVARSLDFEDGQENEDGIPIQPIEGDPTIPHKVLEQHLYLDLDGDGYKEPYLAELHYDTCTPVALRRRYEADDITVYGEGEDQRVISIKPTEFYIKYGFIPNPSGRIYDMGFGMLIGHINSVVSSAINQLLDAGKINNSTGGLISKKLANKLPGRSFRFVPWRFTEVQASVEDLSKHIWTFPDKQPSPVTLNLISTMLDAGKQITSVMDMMTGTNPGQNQPLGTTEMVMQSGLQLFNSIYKRIWRSMEAEFLHLAKLISMYVRDEDYLRILDDPEIMEGNASIATDFDDKSFDIVPSANPEASSQALLASRLRDLVVMSGNGAANPAIVSRLVAEHSGFKELHSDLDELLTPPEPAPDPRVQLEAEKLRHEQTMAWEKLRLEAFKIKQQANKDLAQTIKLLVESDRMVEDADQKRLLDMMEAAMLEQKALNVKADSLGKTIAMVGEEQPQEQAPEEEPS